MAEVVSEMPDPEKTGPKKGSKYDRYLDGQVWKLGPDDCPGGAHSVSNSIYVTAKRRGVQVVIRPRDGFLFVQAKSAAQGTREVRSET